MGMLGSTGGMSFANAAGATSGASFGGMIGGPFDLARYSMMRQAGRAEAKYYGYNQIPWLVAGARSAGIHPNFALGHPGAGSPSMRFGASGAGGGAPAPESASDRRLKDAQAGHLEEMTLASRAARLNQGQPVTTEDGTTVIPLVPSELQHAMPRQLSGRTATPRGQRIEPYVNAPLWTQVEGPDGAMYKILSEALQADELNQVFIAAQMGWDAFNRSTPFNLGRETYDLLRRIARRTSQAEFHRKGRRSQGYRPAVPLPR